MFFNVFLDLATVVGYYAVSRPFFSEVSGSNATAQELGKLGHQERQEVRVTVYTDMIVKISKSYNQMDKKNYIDILQKRTHVSQSSNGNRQTCHQW